MYVRKRQLWHAHCLSPKKIYPTGAVRAKQVDRFTVYVLHRRIGTHTALQHYDACNSCRRSLAASPLVTQAVTCAFHKFTAAHAHAELRVTSTC
jgi:hypothetical protein